MSILSAIIGSFIDDKSGTSRIDVQNESGHVIQPYREIEIRGAEPGEPNLIKIYDSGSTTSIVKTHR